MSFGFASVGHAFATVFADAVKGAKAVASALDKASAAESVIEGISAVVYPPAVIIERAAFATLGKVAAAAHDFNPSNATQLLSVQFDAQELADIKAIVASVKDDLTQLGVLTASSNGAPVKAVLLAPAK